MVNHGRIQRCEGSKSYACQCRGRSNQRKPAVTAKCAKRSQQLVPKHNTPACVLMLLPVLPAAVRLPMTSVLLLVTPPGLPHEHLNTVNQCNSVYVNSGVESRTLNMVRLLSQCSSCSVGHGLRLLSPSFAVTTSACPQVSHELLVLAQSKSSVPAPCPKHT
jgi:hypothetical protein